MYNRVTKGESLDLFHDRRTAELMRWFTDSLKLSAQFRQGQAWDAPVDEHKLMVVVNEAMMDARRVAAGMPVGYTNLQKRVIRERWHMTLAAVASRFLATFLPDRFMCDGELRLLPGVIDQPPLPMGYREDPSDD